MLAPVLALAIFVVAFWFIATERANKVKTVLSPRALMTVLGLIPGADIFYSEHEGIDWNVIFLLLGMMVIVGVIKQTGVFDFLAIWAAKRSRGKPFRLMVMLMIITAIASPVLDNVTIIMLVAPVTLVICDRLRIAAQPFLIAEVLASNIGGAATLIGDPPNIIIGSRAGLTFNDFLVNMAPAVVVIFALFVLFTGALFRNDLRGNDIHLDEVLALQERRAIKDTGLLIRRHGGAGAGHRGLRVAFGVARRALDRRPRRGRDDAVGHQCRCGRGTPRGRVVDSGVLHGFVRHGRRACPHRGHRRARLSGRIGVRRQLLRRRNGAPVRVGDRSAPSSTTSPTPPR